MTLNPKQAVKDWLSEQWDSWIKQPIAKKTEELENQANQQWDKYSNQAKEQVSKPLNYYKEQEAFYRGLFWIAIALLLILWIVSGS